MMVLTGGTVKVVPGTSFLITHVYISQVMKDGKLWLVGVQKKKVPHKSGFKTI